MPTIIRASNCTHELVANTKTWIEWWGREEGSLRANMLASKNTCGGCTGSWSPHPWFSVSLLPWARWGIDRAEECVTVHLENRFKKAEVPTAKPRMRGTIQRHSFPETKSTHCHLQVRNKHFFNFRQLLLTFTWGHTGKMHLNFENSPTWRF